MKKTLLAILRTLFLNCSYSSDLVPKKISQLIGFTYAVNEVSKNDDIVIVQVNETLQIIFTLTPKSYIRDIDVKEL